MIVREKTACLLLSDDPLFQNTLNNILKSNLTLKNIILVNETKEARKRIKNQRFPLIIADGSEVKEEYLLLFKESAANFLLDPAKILFLSRKFLEQDTKKLGDLGIKNTLVKPFDIFRFNEMVNEILLTKDLRSLKAQA